MFLKRQINNLSPIFFGIRARLTAMFVLIFGTTTVIFSIFLYYFLDQSLLKDFDVALYNYSVDVSQTVEIGQNNSLTLPPLKVDEGKIYPFQSGNTLFIIRHISGEILAYGSNSKKFNPRFKDQFKEILAGADSAYHTTTNIHTDDPEAISYRTITFPLDNDVNPTLFLQIAAPMGTFETQLDQMKMILMFGLPAILLIAIVSGLYLSARALRPVQEMIDKTNNINASKLDERVSLPASKDEIKKLAETINLMLERIEIAFQSQEKFISNASHQLLTPITILKGEIELEMKHENNPVKKNFYSSVLQEIDSLSGIVTSMLLLARIDAGKNILNMVDSHPAELILDLLPRMQKLAEQKGIKIKLDIIENGDRVPCRIDEELMAQLFSNLIENAIKYSFENNTILIRVYWNTGSTQIEIEDFGRGVAEAARKDIFSHFSRADTSSKIKGYGLGLSIAQKIAQLHGTEIILEDKSSPGALFSIVLAHSQPQIKIN